MAIVPSQVVLLAAGMGTRLGDLGGGLPKAMFDAGGAKLIDRALTFAALLGARERPDGARSSFERIVVGGFRHDLVAGQIALRSDTADIRILENTRFKLGNLYTLETALPTVTGGFHLMNIDHVYPSAVADRIKEQKGERITAFVDFDRPLGADDMKVGLSPDGHIARIAKTLSTWDCGYVGMTFVPAARLERYRAAVADVRRDVGDAANVEAVLQRLGDDGEPVAIGDISGIGWHELDTPEDVAKALPALKDLR